VAARVDARVRFAWLPRRHSGDAMKISLNWLSDYVDVSMPAADLADLLLRIGFPVASVEETAGDIVLDVEVTSNRPDLLGHLGVAREVAAATGLAFRPPAIGELKTAGRACDLTRVEVLAPDLCPRYTARVIRGLKVGPSPRWIVERLEAVGLRSINNVVDVTNYVMFEYSQPLHAFDYGKLDGHRIVVRCAVDGETIVSIDRTRCQLDSRMLVIADAGRPVAIAGIMGGLDTEVGEATTAVLLESAQFDPLVTRRTSRKLGVLSESNYRMERGIDPVGLDEASRRACQLILQTAGGELAQGAVDVWARPYAPAEVALRTRRTDALLGMAVPPARQEEHLRRLRLSPRVEGERIVCAIPPWRADLTREVDLIEEVARLEGYDRIPVGSKVAHAVTPEALPARVRKAAADVLRCAGFHEALAISFIDAKEAELFGCPQPVRVDALVRKTQNALRPTALPSLLRVCKVNQDAGNVEDVNVFELAQVFPPGEGSGLPAERLELAMIGSAGLRTVRGAVEAIFDRLAPRCKWEIAPHDVAGLEAGGSAWIVVDGKAAGVLGCVAQAVMSHYGLEGAGKNLSAATINLDAIMPHAGEVRKFRPLPRYPAVVRDLSVIVAEDLPWRDLQSAIDAVRQPIRAGLEYVTTYRGKPIADGRKSVTIRLTYRWEDGTLRAEQVDEQVRQVVDALKRDLSAELRE
jgi:phenylalanyl-tRNA synthetase beta chain